jgi:predicted N-acetyltransferase YhbS
MKPQRFMALADRTGGSPRAKTATCRRASRSVPERSLVMSQVRYRIRQARLDDLEALLAMHERSARTLASGFYAPGVIDRLLRHMGTMDRDLIDEGHYFVAETHGGEIAGSGGWSRRAPGHDGGAASTFADSLGEDRALMRSVFVDPQWSRQGIASALVRHAETTAAAAGVRRIALVASLSGVPLYRALGYRVVRTIELECGDGVTIDSVAMAKELCDAPRPHRGLVAA